MLCLKLKNFVKMNFYYYPYASFSLISYLDSIDFESKRSFIDYLPFSLESDYND